MRKICVASLLLLWILASAATFAQASGKIVFTKSEYTREGFEQAAIRGSSKRGWWDLFRRDVCTINPDGTGFKQLTDDGVSYRAEWSLDGQKIAFSWAKSGNCPMKLRKASETLECFMF